MDRKKKSKRWTKGRRQDLVFVCIMLAIPVLQFCIMWLGVNFNSILLAFKKYDLNFNYTWTTANFRNVFKELTSDPWIMDAAKTSFLFYFCTQLLTLPVALFVSFYFYKRWKFARILKTIYFMPSLISGVVTVTVFYIIVDRGYPQLMEFITGEQVLGLLINKDTQKGVILFYNIFYSLTQGFLYFSSSMSNVDDGISEAAQIDGASTLQEFFYITLPSIFPILSVYFIGTLPIIFTSDFSMFAFFKTAGVANFTTLGNHFVVGITTYGEPRYPYYSAFGLVLSLFACILVYGIKGILKVFDPFGDQDGAKAQKRREKKMRKEAKRA